MKSVLKVSYTQKVAEAANALLDIATLGTIFPQLMLVASSAKKLAIAAK